MIYRIYVTNTSLHTYVINAYEDYDDAKRYLAEVNLYDDYLKAWIVASPVLTGELVNSD